MKFTFQAVITAAAVVIAVTCASFAWSTARSARQAALDNEGLLRQIAELQAEEDAYALDIGMEDESEPVAGELIVLQELLDEPTSAVAEMEDEQKLPYFERMELMRTEDPERYREVIEKTEQRQQKLKYYLAERTALFVDLDTSMMTDKEFETHNQLVDRMSEIWDLVGQLQPPAESDNRELLREMTKRMSKIEPLLKKERSTMLKLMAHELGYDSQGARDFKDRVNSIYEYTSLSNAKGSKKQSTGDKQ